MNLDETKNAARIVAKKNRYNIATNSQDGRAAKKVARTFISKVSKFFLQNARRKQRTLLRKARKDGSRIPY